MSIALKLRRAYFGAALAVFSLFVFATQMKLHPSLLSPRHQSLPLFQPHMKDFACAIEVSKVPALDAQAEAWFLEALALEAPETVEEDHDYKKILWLTRQASDRNHWKALLNLSSMYLEGRDPTKGVEDAVRLVEKGMLLGIPAAYDRMGTYFMNGTGVKADATIAFAFWQEAAKRGSPHAMTFLGKKLHATQDSSDGSVWANIPLAKKMFECALSQGFGEAAYELSFMYAGDRTSSGSSGRSREDSAKATALLHQGVKLGCANCADALFIEISRPFNLSDMLVQNVDRARGKRYSVLGDALHLNPNLRFPNLDQVLPLPPAKLPDWDGDEDALINAAMGVKLKPTPPPPTPASKSNGASRRRSHPGSAALRTTHDVRAGARVPSHRHLAALGRSDASAVWNCEPALASIVDKQGACVSGS